MPQGDRRSARQLTPSERKWLRVREYLQANRYELGQQAAELYNDVPKVVGTPLLTTPTWLPASPLHVDEVDLVYSPASAIDGLTVDHPVTESVRPLRADGTRYSTYSAAMADLAAPAVFENRATYRLLAANLSDQRGHLVFGRGAYFDGVDLGEAAAHEYAAAQLNGCPTPIRDAIADPCNPTRRPTNLAISALTIRHDRSTDAGTFFLHWRDPAKVGHAGGLYMVVPVGIFQPSSDHPSSARNDFSLWRCLLREYAEELLGEAEIAGTNGPIDYDNWPFAGRMTNEAHRGSLRAYCLGIGVDPLTLATDLLTVVVIDGTVFDELFGALVESNAEGRLVHRSDGSRGLPFTQSDVARLTTREPMQAAGAAAVAAAWAHRRQLLAS